MENNNETRCGFVAIVGRPNVGKSTLLNYMVGQKISITADKPQTTRHRITGVKTKENAQAVFIDTPGIHLKGKRAINKQMNKAARTSLSDVDAVIFVTEGTRWTSEDQMVFEIVEKLSCPVFWVVNKVDMIKQKETLLPHIQKRSQAFQFTDIIPVSAQVGTQVEVLEKNIFGCLPEGPFFYEESQVTDRSERFRMAEIIREKLTRNMSQELPYALTVEIEQVKQEEDQLVIHAVIWVEKSSQKVIVIGKKGENLKNIGTQARMDLNRLLDTRVHLQLWVKVREGWSDDDRALKSLGYTDLD